MPDARVLGRGSHSAHARLYQEWSIPILWERSRLGRLQLQARADSSNSGRERSCPIVYCPIVYSTTLTTRCMLLCPEPQK